jgi:tellurite resistance protein TerA
MGGLDASKTALTAADAQRVLACTGSLRVNMHWSAQNAPPAGARGPVFDVDLGCLYELADGKLGVVQYLGALRGAFDRAPYIQLDHDDRAGSAAGENLFINLDRADRLRRVLIFVYAHNGPLAGARIGVDFLPTTSKPFRIALEKVPADTHACAVAELTFTDGHVTVHREVRYVPGFQEELARSYGFKLRWARADKPGLG